MRKKAVSPAHRRVVAQELVKNKACSQRAACRILRLARSTFRYRGQPGLLPGLPTTAARRRGVSGGFNFLCP
jgi:ribosomal protein S14